jgi:hypothetical protein
MNGNLKWFARTKAGGSGNSQSWRVLESLVEKRRFRWWMIGVGVGTACIVPVAWPKSPDGFEFLREFEPKEYRTQNPFCDLREDTPPYDSSRGWYRVFRFPSMDSVQVRNELKKHSPNTYVQGDLFVVLPNGRRGNYYDGSRMLALYNEPPPSWLQSKYLELQNGLKK